MSARAEDRTAGGAADDAGAVRRRQLLLFSVVAAVVLVAVAAWLGMGGGKAPAPAGGIDAGIVTPDAAEKVWTRRSEARLGKIETNLRHMQQEARTLRADNDRLRGKLERDAADARTVIDRQAAVIDEMQRRMLVGPCRRQLAVPAGGRRGLRQRRRRRSCGARRGRGAEEAAGGAAVATARRRARIACPGALRGEVRRRFRPLRLADAAVRHGRGR